MTWRWREIFLDLNKIKVDKDSYKNTLISCIGYVTVKDLRYIKISVNLLYISVNKINGYFEKSIEINIQY